MTRQDERDSMMTDSGLSPAFRETPQAAAARPPAATVPAPPPGNDPQQPPPAASAQARPGLECRRCGCRHFEVRNTVNVRQGIKRYRQCRHCGLVTTTMEKTL